MGINKNEIEEFQHFNIGDEVISKASGRKHVVVFQDGETVTTWYPAKRKSAFLGYTYLLPYMQVFDAYAIKKTGKTYPELALTLKEMIDNE